MFVQRTWRSFGSRYPLLLAAVVLLWCFANAVAQAPYFDARSKPGEYAGPGRDDAEPANLTEVRIGYFGPAEGDAPNTDLWHAASLAIEQANRAGGYRGIPFRLVPAWADDPWRAGAAMMVRLVYGDNLWAVIGGPDGASTHLAEQVVAKARLPLISPASTDKTVNMANVAWAFSCLPSDDMQAVVLGDELIRAAGRDGFVLVAATDHDSHHSMLELVKYLRRRGAAPVRHFEIAPGDARFDDLAAAVGASGATAVAVYAPPEQAAAVVQAIRAEMPGIALFGGPSFGRAAFQRAAGPAAAGAIFPLLCDALLPAGWVEEFSRRRGHSPDCSSVQTYDAVMMAVEAVRRTGLNRARIRDAIAAMSGWSGAAGTIAWDNVRQNQRPVRLGRQAGMPVSTWRAAP